MISNIEFELSKNDFMTLLKSSKTQLTLIDFYADWCEPCKWLSDLLDEILPDIMGSTTIVKIDIDKSPALKAAYQINSVPVLLLFKEDILVWRINGFLSGPELKRKVESFIG